MSSLPEGRALLIAALGFAQLAWRNRIPPAARLLACWLDSWRGVGAIVVGMTAQGFNLEIKEFPEGWRANFYPVGIAHSVVCGSAYESTPWRAVQTAAWDAVNDRRSTVAG